MNIGNNIRSLRKQKNLTQEQVAEKLGVSYQAVSRWENNANTPDIALLPEIASVFGVSIDTLFAKNIEGFSDELSFIRDDDVIRIIQMRGTKVIKVTPQPSSVDPPIEIAFPHNCNDKTQYFKVEVYGHIISDSSINGDVVCQNLQCSVINGDVKAGGDINVNAINSIGTIACRNIKDCYKMEANKIDCSGNVASANLTCGQIVYHR